MDVRCAGGVHCGGLVTRDAVSRVRSPIYLGEWATKLRLQSMCVCVTQRKCMTNIFIMAEIKWDLYIEPGRETFRFHGYIYGQHESIVCIKA